MASTLTSDGAASGASGGPDGSDPFAAPASPRRRVGPAVVFTLVTYGLTLVACVALVLAGLGLLGMPERESLVTAGLVGVFFVLTVGPAGLVIALWSSTAATVRLNAAIKELNESVRVLSEQAALSDDARRVLNRPAEREMLCRAIEADIAVGDWEAALVLCGELADRFGYRADAEGFRTRIEAGRAETLGLAVREGVAQVEGMLLQRRYDEADAEARRLARLYPEQPRIGALPERVAQARGLYKEDLRRRFLDAVKHDKIDAAMNLMRELDVYLTEHEAGPLREVARGVVTKARENLGALFKLAVEDRAWAQAVELGRRIIAEFPNSKMAVEVRGMLDGLLARANAEGK
jgi:hypothetical protein